MEQNKESSEVKDILPQDYSHEITSFDFSSANDFTLILRASILTEQDGKEWIKEFGKNTCTNWIVAKTVKLQKYVYKATFACHRSSKNKAKNPKVNTGRNTDCRAEIKVLIKKVNRSTKRNDALLKRSKPLAGVININFTHNHDIRCGDAMRLLRVTPETREAYVNYFNEGLCVAAARRAHEARLLETSAENLSNAAENPCERTVRHIFHLWQKGTYRHKEINESDMLIATIQRQPSEILVAKIEVDSVDLNIRDSTDMNDFEETNHNASDPIDDNIFVSAENTELAEDNDALNTADTNVMEEDPLALPPAAATDMGIRKQIKQKWIVLERLLGTMKEHTIKYGDASTNLGLTRMTEELSKSAGNVASINKFLHTSFRS